jgi:hypothetical protein
MAAIKGYLAPIDLLPLVNRVQHILEALHTAESHWGKTYLRSEKFNESPTTETQITADVRDDADAFEIVVSRAAEAY